MHALDDIDDLADPEVRRRREVGVGQRGVHAERGLQEGDGGADGRCRLRWRCCWASLSKGVTVTAVVSCLSSGHDESAVPAVDETKTSSWRAVLL